MSRNSIAVRPSSSPTPYSSGNVNSGGQGMGTGAVPPGTSHGGRATSPASGLHHRAAALLNGRPQAATAGPSSLLFGVSGASVPIGSTPTLPPAANGGNGYGYGRRDKETERSVARSSAAAANGGLRPLPQTGRHSGGLLNMMILGHSAGEGRTLVPTEPRAPVEKKSNSAPVDTGINKEARDTAKIKRLESEIEKLKELVKKRTGERDKANKRIEELERELSDSQKKNRDLEASSSATILEKSQQIVDLQLKMKQLEEKMAKQNTDNEKQRSQHGKVGEELEGLKGLLAKEKKERGESEAALQKQIADLQKLISDADDSKRRNSSDLQSQIARLQQELAAKTKESVDWEGKAKAFENELKSQEALFAEWKARIEAINAYILQICQPQFSVVKDESLAPVVPNGEATSSPEGFVLVPLPLMLQGYGLLPQELKKRIANDYEANKKGLAGALPRRSSRSGD